MAAAAWQIYNAAKRNIANGAIDLDSDVFRLSLFTSASNVLDMVGLSAVGSCTGEVIEAFGYSSSGKPLTGVQWTQSASAAEMKFTCSPVIFGAAFGNIVGVKFAVIWKQGLSAGANKLLACSQLSAVAFFIPSGNNLTIQPAPTGVFTLK